MDHNVRDQSASSYDLRIGTLEDVPAMASLAAGTGADPRVVAFGCERVVRERFGFSVLVTASTGGKKRLVGFMNAPLLKPRMGDRVRCGGVPFSHILASDESRFVANEAEVGRGNGDAGNDLIISHYFQEPIFSAPGGERILMLLIAGFVDRFIGNHVRSVFVETRGMESAQGAEGGGYSIVDTYEDWYARTGGAESERPVLLQSDRLRAVRNHNFHLARLLEYQAPILRFPPAAREVIRCAYLGYNDATIIEESKMTPASLNSRWTRIFDIVENRMPSLFAEGGRGRSRDRAPILAYVRNHPEEMWPYDPVKDA